MPKRILSLPTFVGVMNLERILAGLLSVFRAILRLGFAVLRNGMVGRTSAPATLAVAVGTLVTILAAAPARAQFCDTAADCDDGIACTIDDCIPVFLFGVCKNVLDGVNCQIDGDSSTGSSSCDHSNDDQHSCVFTATGGVSTLQPEFESRFSFGLCADGDNGGDNSIRGTAQHEVTVTVKTPGKYRLEVRHGWAGDMQAEHFGISEAGNGNVSDVTGSWSGPGSITPGFVGLADPGEAHVEGHLFARHERVDIDDSASFSITDTSNGKPRFHKLVFNWDGHARGAGDTIGSVRLGEGHWDPGFNSAQSNEQICKYPGDPDRSQSGDGHQVFVKVVPLCGNGRIDTEVGESCDPTAPQAGVNCTENCTSPCGNGIVDAGEECDPSAGDSSECCDASCQFSPSSTLCRDLSGTCDEREYCTGSSASCPSDRLKSAGEVCRSVSSPCDAPEVCTGSSVSCPSNGVRSAGFPCRPRRDLCDVEEDCTGSSAFCPTDSFASSATQCRASAGTCDVAENCTGSGVACPTDTAAKAGTTCRTASGECDATETCNGSSTTCPTDVAAADGTACGDSDGEDCTLAACQSGQCAQTYNSCVSACRSPVFWGWHAGAEQKVTTNLALSVLRGTPNARLLVCGETLDDTDRDSASSVEEALCLPGERVPTSRLQLVRQLTAAKLNCVANGEAPECLNLIQQCDTLCQNPAAPASSVTACIQDLELLNGGLSLLAAGCDRDALPGFTVTPLSSVKKCTEARGSACTVITDGEASCKAGTNTPD